MKIEELKEVLSQKVREIEERHFVIKHEEILCSKISKKDDIYRVTIIFSLILDASKFKKLGVLENTTITPHIDFTLDLGYYRDEYILNVINDVFTKFETFISDIEKTTEKPVPDIGVV